MYPIETNPISETRETLFRVNAEEINGENKRQRGDLWESSDEAARLPTALDNHEITVQSLDESALVSLPSEILAHMLRFLDSSSLKNCRFTCHRINELMRCELPRIINLGKLPYEAIRCLLPLCDTNLIRYLNVSQFTIGSTRETSIFFRILSNADTVMLGNKIILPSVISRLNPKITTLQFSIERNNPLDKFEPRMLSAFSKLTKLQIFERSFFPRYEMVELLNTLPALQFFEYSINGKTNDSKPDLLYLENESLIMERKCEGMYLKLKNMHHLDFFDLFSIQSLQNTNFLTISNPCDFVSQPDALFDAEGNKLPELQHTFSLLHSLKTVHITSLLNFAERNLDESVVNLGEYIEGLSHVPTLSNITITLPSHYSSRFTDKVNEVLLRTGMKVNRILN